MIEACNIEYEVIYFPSGEPHVRITNAPYYEQLHITYKPEHSSGLTEELFTLALLVEAAVNVHKMKPTSLAIHYCPFGRQDRRAVSGDAFSLKVFADFINALRFDSVFLYDPHSDVAPALINNSAVVPQVHCVFGALVDQQDPYYLVSPDAGAHKKTHAVAAEAPKLKPISVIECTKRRDPTTGALSGFNVPHYQLVDADMLIVDDICDGGGTFLAIAEHLRRFTTGKIKLAVSHGVFSKGLGVFDGVIDHIYANGEWVK